MAYGRIEETFWHDPKIRALSEDGRNLMLYLLTCPRKNRLGCFALDPFYAAAGPPVGRRAGPDSPCRAHRRRAGGMGPGSTESSS